MRPMINKYSQYNEELFLMEYFKGRLGVVVEIGAADGTTNSNSRRLIENGWSAILVEPNFNNYTKIKELYKENNIVSVENCGCSDVSKKDTFYIDHNDKYQQLSTFNPTQVKKCKDIYSCEFEEKEVQILKTSDLFDKHKITKIDFLSIDTESYDKNVVLGIDFGKIDIEIICIEDEEASEILIKNGYQFFYKTIGNLIFKKNLRQ
jgi:FkbM family methyltransferase